MLRRAGIRERGMLLAAACGGGLLAAAAAQAAGLDAGTTGETGALLRLGGRLHPLIVHFPIALLLTAALVESFQRLRRRPRPSATALTCLTLGVIAAAAAVASGLANERYESHGQSLVAAIDRHQLFGIIAGSTGAAALALGLLTLAINHKIVRWTYFATLLAAGTLTGVTGHFGGSLVFGEDYLTSVWRREAKTQAAAAPPVDPAAMERELEDLESVAGVYFEPQVRAILESRCAECHGPSRQRGGLRLDQYSSIFENDPAIWVVQPFEPQASEMFRRISLPQGDEDAMPAKGERLTAGQIALIEQWIAQGAKEAPAARSPDAAAIESSEVFDQTFAQAQVTLPPPEIDWESIKPADPVKAGEATARLRARGVAARQIFRGSEAIEVNFSLLGPEIADDNLALLTGLEDTLIRLNLAGTSITDDGLAALSRFTQIRRLHLERTAIGDRGVESIASLPELDYLNLYGTLITDAALETLQRAPKLRELYLWRSGVSAQGVAQFRLACPNVTVQWSAPEGPKVESVDNPASEIETADEK